MIRYREALQCVLGAAAALPARRVGLGDALGLVAAEDVFATDPVPPFTNSDPPFADQRPFGSPKLKAGAKS